MKSINITQVVGGFIVTITDNTITDKNEFGQQQQSIKVTPNLGRATKLARQLFGEDAAEVVESPVTEVAIKAPVAVVESGKARKAA